jgi:glycosyltransferase involved in cell wall biosynthesis
MKNNKPLVSVCIRSYNQQKFIAEAIESVIKQETDFVFEVIISDDCSKDKTIEIIQNYIQKYPNVIRLITSDSNVGGPNNLRRVIEASVAKYIVCLDGDDYFISKDKLQKQIDFLETHPEYSACFHNTMNVSEEGIEQGIFNPIDFHAVHDAKEFITKKWFVPIHSAMIRRELIEFPEWYDTVMNDDYVIHLSVVKNAPYYYMPDVMVAYRHHSNEISVAYKNPILINKQLKLILENEKFLYPIEYSTIFDKKIDEYQKLIDFYQREERQPWRKYMRLKTYKRLVKKLIRH